MDNHTMKKNPLAGAGKVYVFTLKQMLLSRGWLIATFLVAAMMLFGIPILMHAVTHSGSHDGDDDEAEIRHVIVVDETEGTADYSVLNEEQDQFTADYEAHPSMDTAISAATAYEDAVILRVTKPEKTYFLTVYLPQNTKISRSKASSYAAAAESGFSAVLMQKAELTPEEVMLLSMPVRTETLSVNADMETEADDSSLAKELIGLFLPFFCLILVYMMVVTYGQSMSNSVMLEKTSKLMETILTAVHPVALMTGKLFATTTAAVIQIMIWVFSIFGGIVAGSAAMMKFVPDADNQTVELVGEAVTNLTAIPVGGILLSIVILSLGFLLYLSVSATVGAMATKMEDLNKTNVIFVGLILVSMLLCIAQPSMENAAAGTDVSIISDALWLRFFPFTSILVVPGDLLTGKHSLLFGCGTVAILIVSVCLLITFAAAVYKLLVLYRGAPPSFKQLTAMFREDRKRKQTAPDDQDAAQ